MADHIEKRRRDPYRSRRAEAASLSSPPSRSRTGVDWSDVEFVDLGCSHGGSIAHCQKRFQAGRGIGIDVDEAKVARAREAGVEAVLADATTLDLDQQVRFISMMHFLEHLPTLETVATVIAAAARSATDFLFIQHPSFEGEEYLEMLGLRQYWWHWTGHPTHIKVSDYCRMFESAGVGPYMIRYVEPIYDSQHASILPISAPKNQREYDPALHGPKIDARFESPLWRTQEIFVALRAIAPAEWATITTPGSTRTG